MKFWTCSILVCLFLGCARGSGTPAPTEAESTKSSPVVSVAQPTTEKKNDAPTKDIAKPQENPQVIRTNEKGVLRGIVRRERGIANAVLWLTPVGQTTLPSPPIETVRLSVEQGTYRPPVLLAQKGSVLELRTVDERADFQASGAATFSETIERGTMRTFPLSTPGRIEVRSQLHPQCAPASVWVLDGVPGVRTGSDGRFQFPPVSSGDYELILGYEKQPPVRVRITLGTHEGVEVRWTLPQ